MNAPPTPKRDNAREQAGEVGKTNQTQDQHTNRAPFTQAELAEIRAIAAAIKDRTVLEWGLAEQIERACDAYERAMS